MRITEKSQGFEDPDHVILLFSTCLAGLPDTSRDFRSVTLRLRALAYEQKKDYKQAIADLEESARLNPPRTGWEIITLASNFRADRQPQRAVELLRKMLKDNMGLAGKGTSPGMPSYYHLGQSLVDLQQWSDAAEAFSEGMTYQQDYVWAYAYRSLAYDRMELPELARADIDKVRSLLRDLKPSDGERNRQALKKSPFEELLTKYPDEGG